MKTLRWALGLIAGAALASDPAWIAGVAQNDVGGIMSLTAIQDADCSGEWYVLRSATPKGLLHGCWKFLGESGLIALAWSDGTITQAKATDIGWADWTQDKAEPVKPSAPKITPKKGDIIS